MTRRLGRGLADLIEPRVEKPQDLSRSGATGAPASAAGPFTHIPVSQIHTGKYQPRTDVSEEGLEELKASIRRQGVIEPVIVRPLAEGGYELVAGERRWRAAKAVGLAEIPALVKPLADKEALEYALIENIQREDLNPWEEARGYLRLIEEFGYTQDDVAAAVGKERATVANLLRVLRLPDDVQQAVRDGRLSLGHAKVLLGVDGAARQRQLFERVMKEQLSVRQLEGQAAAWSPRRRSRRVSDAGSSALEQALRQRLATKVHVAAKEKGGRIIIEYFSQEDLMRLTTLLGVTT